MKVTLLLKRTSLAALVAVLFAASAGTVRADLVTTGSTFYSYDFEDGTLGSLPTSSSGEVTWSELSGGVFAGGTTRIQNGPVVGTNKTMYSDADALGKRSLVKAKFSTAMQTALPTSGTIGFRLYADYIATVTGFSVPTVFAVMKDVGASVSGSNYLFGLDVSTSNMTFLSDGTFASMRPTVLDEWIDVSIDYTLDNTPDNITVTLNSTSILNESYNFSRDLTGDTSNGFISYNRNGNATTDLGDENLYYIDDISWVTAAVPEPSSFAFGSLIALLAGGVRRKHAV